jgi:manganese-dependent ADP-ribose/CDP-alcohol diphosphatase
MISGEITRRDFSRILAGGVFSLVASGRLLGDDAQAADGQFAFGVVTDAQYCDAKSGGSRHYRASAEKLAACVESFNKMDLAFVIHLGDFIDRDFASFDVMQPIFNRLKTPHYHVLGNHEFSVAQDRLNDVPEKLALQNRYYRFCHGGWRFVVLNGNDLSLIAHPKDSARYTESRAQFDDLKKRRAVNAQTWNGGVGETQLTWLAGELEAADAAHEKVVVFCHFPVYPVDPHNLWNSEQLVGLLESHPSAVAYMNGHNHRGNYAEKSGIHYVTFPGMVETADTTAYAVIHAHPDSLKVVGHGRTPSRSLKCRP